MSWIPTYIRPKFNPPVPGKPGQLITPHISVTIITTVIILARLTQLQDVNELTALPASFVLTPVVSNASKTLALPHAVRGSRLEITSGRRVGPLSLNKRCDWGPE